MTDSRYFSLEQIIAETLQLAQESRYLRTRSLLELLAATFLLLFWFDGSRTPSLSRLLTFLPFVVNATAWIYWLTFSFPRLLSIAVHRAERLAETFDDPDRAIDRLEARAHAVRRERMIAGLVDMLVALQFIVITLTMAMSLFG